MDKKVCICAHSFYVNNIPFLVTVVTDAFVYNLFACYVNPKSFGLDDSITIIKSVLNTRLSQAFELLLNTRLTALINQRKISETLRLVMRPFIIAVEVAA